VGVQILVDGDLYQTVWTAWSVELWERHPVLTRNVMRGEALSPSVVETRRVRLGAGFRGEPLGANALLGSVAVRDLAAGSVLFGRDVQRKRLIERGDIISVEVRRGTITARTTAIAQQDGRRGDRIRVQATTSGRELVGVVVSRALVEVRF
jgi:flagella basal body P-ring formation protein FlgA